MRAATRRSVETAVIRVEERFLAALGMMEGALGMTDGGLAESVGAGRLEDEAAFCLAEDCRGIAGEEISGGRSSAEGTTAVRPESVSRLRRWSSARMSEA